MKNRLEGRVQWGGEVSCELGFQRIQGGQPIRAIGLADFKSGGLIVLFLALTCSCMSF